MGTVVISLDAELGWGFHHEVPLPAARIRDARTAWIELLDLFDEYDVPATWALVGHLLTADCVGGHTGHPAGPQRCVTAPDGIRRENAWFDNGLLDRIVGADADHELASHGYTHVHFAHEQMDREMATAECGAAARALRDRGFDPHSFVFPVNQVGYRDLLAEHGFSCYRGTVPGRSGTLEKLGNALFGRGTPPIVRPTVDEHGLVNVPASLYLYSFEGVTRRVVEGLRDDPIVSAVRRGLDSLLGTDGVLHLWLHPHNVSSDRDRRRMRRVLDAIDNARRETDIQIETMETVAQLTVERET